MDPLESADCPHGIGFQYSHSLLGIRLVDESDRLHIWEGMPGNMCRIPTGFVPHTVGLSATNLEAPYLNPLAY